MGGSSAYYSYPTLPHTSSSTLIPHDTSSSAPQVLEVAHAIYTKMDKPHDAMRVALRLNRRPLVEETFAACADPLAKKQLCYLLARHGFSLKLDEGVTEVRGGGCLEGCCGSDGLCSTESYGSSRTGCVWGTGWIASLR